MKLNKKLIRNFSFVAILSILIVTACKKESSTTPSAATLKLSTYLTDNPSSFDAVLIDIRYVEVKLDTVESHKNDDHFGDNDNDRENDGKGRDDFGKWDTLKIVPGVYDVAKLRNGVDTLLGSKDINGTIRKIRITIGDNNSLIIAGVSVPLYLSNDINHYLYIKIHDNDHQEAEAGQTALWIDFDISRSIVQDPNLKFWLKPVLKPFCDNKSASIKGIVLPGAATPLVIVFNDKDTSIAIPKENGEFRIRGLNEGTYNIVFKGFNGYRDTTIMNIVVKKTVEQTIPTITLIH